MKEFAMVAVNKLHTSKVKKHSKQIYSLDQISSKY